MIKGNLLEILTLSANIRNAMKNNLNHITGLIAKSFRFIFFAAIFNSFINAQTVSNLERFYVIVDSASSLLLNDLGNLKEVKLDLSLGNYYSVFGNHIRNKLLKHGIKLINDAADTNAIIVNFVIDNCNVKYSKPEKDGLFGNFYTERTVEVSGNYFISENGLVKNYYITEKDTLNIENLKGVEDRSYPFTQGELPPEPFISSVLEPIVAVGAAAIAIILFFSVRSK